MSFGLGLLGGFVAIAIVAIAAGICYLLLSIIAEGYRH